MNSANTRGIYWALDVATNLRLYCFLLCFYFVFVLRSTHQMSKLLAVKVLKFSISLSTYSIIYSEKYPLYLGKLYSRVWSVPGPLFRFPLIAKRYAWDEVVLIIYVLLGFAIVKYFLYLNLICFCDLFAQSNSPCHDPDIQKLSFDFSTFKFCCSLLFDESLG